LYQINTKIWVDRLRRLGKMR